MYYNIEIENINKKNGFIEGIIYKYNFYAQIKEENDSNGLNLSTMKKGDGRIVKLCIYKDEIDNSGDPFLPTVSIKRHIFMNYDGDWKIYNFRFEELLIELVKYLDRRSSIKIVK